MPKKKTVNEKNSNQRPNVTKESLETENRRLYNENVDLYNENVCLKNQLWDLRSGVIELNEKVEDLEEMNRKLIDDNEEFLDDNIALVHHLEKMKRDRTVRILEITFMWIVLVFGAVMMYIGIK